MPLFISNTRGPVHRFCVLVRAWHLAAGPNTKTGGHEEGSIEARCSHCPEI